MKETSWLRQFVYKHCLRPEVLWADRSSEIKVSGILILSKHPNPTFSYYLEERIAAAGSLPVIVKDIDQSLESIDPTGLFVIICRYIKPKQLRWLEAHRRRVADVVYFVDDDIAAVIAGPEARWFYKWKLVRMAVFPMRRLNPLLGSVWASTEALASALSHANSAITLLPPYPPSGIVREAKVRYSEPLTMIYHATGVHRREHAFILPIVEAAMRRHAELRFEVIANGEVARWWRNSSIDDHRLTIRAAMSWNNYLQTTRRHGADIALVPLLEGQVNDARSDTKRIDVARLDASAIFSHCAVYQRCAMPEEIHVANTAREWGRAIDALVENSELREAARRATRESITLMRARTTLQFPGLSFEPATVRTCS